MIYHNITERIYDADLSLELLKAGNKRYIENDLNATVNYTSMRSQLANEQNPFCIILSCSDSRLAPEIIFDQKIGDLFTIRNAGNIVDNATLGSIEYGVSVLEIPLIVVLGHSSCGAITAAFNPDEIGGSLQNILDKIRLSRKFSKDVDGLMLENIQSTMEEIQDNPIIQKHKTKVVGAYYDIITGKVHWI